MMHTKIVKISQKREKNLATESIGGANKARGVFCIVLDGQLRYTIGQGMLHERVVIGLVERNLSCWLRRLRVLVML
jgi:hypothetical protein